jgi:hypothetical protein
MYREQKPKRSVVDLDPYPDWIWIEEGKNVPEKLENS